MPPARSRKVVESESHVETTPLPWGKLVWVNHFGQLKGTRNCHWFTKEQWISIDFIVDFILWPLSEPVKKDWSWRNHSIAKRLLSCVANIFKLGNQVLNVTHPMKHMKQETKKNDILKKTTWNLFFVSKLVGHTSLWLPNASHLFNAAFYQPRDRTPTRLTIGSIWGTPKQSPELSDCLALKVSPAKAKTLNPRFSSKALFFSLDLVFFFRWKKMGFIGNKLTKPNMSFV